MAAGSLHGTTPAGAGGVGFSPRFWPEGPPPEHGRTTQLLLSPAAHSGAYHKLLTLRGQVQRSGRRREVHCCRRSRRVTQKGRTARVLHGPRRTDNTTPDNMAFAGSATHAYATLCLDPVRGRRPLADHQAGWYFVEHVNALWLVCVCREPLGPVLWRLLRSALFARSLVWFRGAESKSDSGTELGTSGEPIPSGKAGASVRSDETTAASTS